VEESRGRIAGKDFDGTEIKARQEWNESLSRIRATSADLAILQTFYTALYQEIRRNISRMGSYVFEMILWDRGLGSQIDGAKND
jgi:hypothetical protein